MEEYRLAKAIFADDRRWLNGTGERAAADSRTFKPFPSKHQAQSMTGVNSMAIETNVLII